MYRFHGLRRKSVLLDYQKALQNQAESRTALCFPQFEILNLWLLMWRAIILKSISKRNTVLSTTRNNESVRFCLLLSRDASDYSWWEKLFSTIKTPLVRWILVFSASDKDAMYRICCKEFVILENYCFTILFGSFNCNFSILTLRLKVLFKK